MGPAGTDLRRIPEYVKTRVLLPQHGMYPGGGIPIAFSIVSLSFFTVVLRLSESRLLRRTVARDRLTF